jgi:hypothetical protein
LTEFEAHVNEEDADLLFNTLSENRKEIWRSKTEGLDFTRSSRKAWNLVRKLGETPTINQGTTAITANNVANRLLNASKLKIDHKWFTEVRKDWRRTKKQLILEPDIIEFSSPFTMSELELALSQIKKNKSSGLDKILPEILIYLGPNSCRYLVKLFNVILETGELPKFFKVTKIHTIKKLGKEGNDAVDYRTISLLSSSYKFLERLIHN